MKNYADRGEYSVTEVDDSFRYTCYSLKILYLSVNNLAFSQTFFKTFLATVSGCRQMFFLQILLKM